MRNVKCIFGRSLNSPFFDSMTDPAFTILPMAAVGYSMLYLILGGGLDAAVVIFFPAKLLGK
jgi:hypothetical protein